MQDAPTPIAATNESHTGSQSSRHSTVPFARVWKEIFDRHCFAPPSEMEKRKYNKFYSCQSDGEVITSNATTRQRGCINAAGNDDGKYEDSDYYLDLCRERRNVVSNLMYPRRKRQCKKLTSSRELKAATTTKKLSSFHLPNRYCHFVPMVPTDFYTQGDGQQDSNSSSNLPFYPPVDFNCMSFAFTSAGTEGELMLLNPFDETLCVYRALLDNAVASDEAMIEKAMVNAATMIIRERQSTSTRTGESEVTATTSTTKTSTTSSTTTMVAVTDGQHEVWRREEHVIAGDVFHESVYRNHNMERYRTPPSQILYSEEDYAGENPDDFFLPTSPLQARNGGNDRRRPVATANDDNNNAIEQANGENLICDWLGVDVHHMINEEHETMGTMVGAARYVCNNENNLEDFATCTEFLGWKRLVGSDSSSNNNRDPRNDFHQKVVCRMDNSPYFMDVCGVKDRVYAVFAQGGGPTVPHDYDNAVSDPQLHPGASMLGKWIHVYPLLYIDENSKERDSFLNSGSSCINKKKYFPSLTFAFRCKNDIETLASEPTGNRLIVGTANGTIEIWNVRGETPFLEVSYDVFESLEKGLKSRTADNSHTSSSASDEEVGSTFSAVEIIHVEEGNFIHGNAAPAVMPVERVSGVFPSNRSKKVDVRCSGSVSMDKSGFVTIQHHEVDGTTLLLWQKTSTGDGGFYITSKIQLPLATSRRTPSVAFDGRRIIVFGRDRIGCVILVYHVVSTSVEDQIWQGDDARVDVEDSRGVVTFSPKGHHLSAVRYVNRIRHAAIGLLDRFDAFFLSVNERFIVVNTKTGNLIGEGGGGSSASEGLFVIDLEEHLCKTYTLIF